MNIQNQLKWICPRLLIGSALVLSCLVLSPSVQAAPNSNTSYGRGALPGNTMGDFNSAFGFNALSVNSTGSNNTAIGWQALGMNTNGENNTAIGDGALANNMTGVNNTATGAGALGQGTGDQNTAIGTGALGQVTGGQNTAIGANALVRSTTGIENTALGHDAGLNVQTASNVICIGANVAGADVSNTTWIGNVYGVTTQNGTTAPVIVSAAGQLGTLASSERFKKDIATMEKASEGILSLRPFTFHYKSDVKDFPQFGLIAEEVAKVNPALVLPDKEGKPYTVRYDAVNAMLLNEFLKARRQIDAQQKQIDALTAGLQKVSAQLEVSKPAQQTVLKDQ
jgi:Chaperone of endosialidase